LDGNFGFEPTFIPEKAFGFQAFLIGWATRKGRAAIFADCGMGKTLMQLSFAENVVRKSNRPVLVLTPLAVGAQSVKEAAKFGIEAVHCRDGNHGGKARVVITNYERLHYFNPSDFSGTVCDESSILKNFDGATKEQVTRFMSKQPYRLLCTATAAPNDYVELGTSSEALGHLQYLDMLKRFFKNDSNTYARGGSNGQGARRFITSGGEGGKWRFRGHSERDFWRWVCSWARAIRKPSDIGFDDGELILPPLITREHLIHSEAKPDDMLFALPAFGLQEERAENRRTLAERCEKAASLVSASAGHSMAWCHLNTEGDMLEEMIPGAQQINGSDSDEEKEEKIEWFINGTETRRVLVSKPTILGFGLNLQHCAHQTFFPSHSFEQYYQCVRRSWRFGQKNPVTIDLVTSNGNAGVLANLQRKAAAAEQMFQTLVELMNNELHLARKTRTETSVTIPSWL
jgi:hypothetical protein